MLPRASDAPQNQATRPGTRASARAAHRRATSLRRWARRPGAVAALVGLTVSPAVGVAVATQIVDGDEGETEYGYAHVITVDSTAWVDDTAEGVNEGWLRYCEAVDLEGNVTVRTSDIPGFEDHAPPTVEEDAENDDLAPELDPGDDDSDVWDDDAIRPDEFVAEVLDVEPEDSVVEPVETTNDDLVEPAVDPVETTNDDLVEPAVDPVGTTEPVEPAPFDFLDEPEPTQTTCTLRAAIELSNFMPGNESDNRILIEVDPSITATEAQRLGTGNMAPPREVLTLPGAPRPLWPTGTSPNYPVWPSATASFDTLPAYDWNGTALLTHTSNNARMARATVVGANHWIWENIQMDGRDRGAIQFAAFDGPDFPTTQCDVPCSNMSVNQRHGRGGGAIFHIESPVTIDLDDRLLPYWGWTRMNVRNVSLFHVESSNVNLLNISQPLASSTSFVIAPGVSNIVIDGSEDLNGIRSTAISQNAVPERFLVVREGVTNLTVRGYELRGFASSGGVLGNAATNANAGTTGSEVAAAGSMTEQSNVGLIVFQNYGATIPIDSVAFEDFMVRHPADTGAPTAATCNSTTVTNCRPQLLRFVGSSTINADAVRVNNLTFDGLHLENFNNGNSRMLSFTGTLGGTNEAITGAAANTAVEVVRPTSGGNAPAIQNLTVVNSRFVNNHGSTNLDRAWISLPPWGRLSGTTRIQGNLFHSPRAHNQVPVSTAQSSAQWTAQNNASIDNNQSAISIQGGGPATATITATHPSGIHISDNHFDGINGRFGVVWAFRAGTVTVERNTFSSGSSGRFRTTATNNAWNAAGAHPTWNSEEEASGPYTEGFTNTTTSSNPGQRAMGGGMFRNGNGNTAVNTGGTTNRQMSSWFVNTNSAATPIRAATFDEIGAAENGQAGSRLMADNDSSRFEGVPTCAVVARIQANDGGGASVTRIANIQMRHDIYWTLDNQAEVFLGSVYPAALTTATAGGQHEGIIVNLPIGELEIPGLRNLTRTIIDPTDINAQGMLASGNLRIQSHGIGIPTARTQPESAQFSRVTPLPARLDCSPTLTIEELGTDSTYTDPQHTRFLDFRVSSNFPLDLTTLYRTDSNGNQLLDANGNQMSSIEMDVASTEHTLNRGAEAPGPVAVGHPLYGQINARIVSVTPVIEEDQGPGDDFLDEPCDPHEQPDCVEHETPLPPVMAVDVRVAVDDSASVTLSIPGGRIRSAHGIVVPGDATGTNRTAVFRNPLYVTPTPIRLVAGDPIGLWYSVGIRETSRTAHDTLLLEGTAHSTSALPQFDLATEDGHPFVIAGGQRSSTRVNVTIEDVATTVDGIALYVGHRQVRSGDPCFDGLHVPQLDVLLYSTDPHISITRWAFVNPRLPGGGYGTGLTDASGNLMINNGMDALESIRANGFDLSTPLLSGYQGEPVCFIWRVQNTSPDNWESGLTNLRVVDTDERLGDQGVIFEGSTFPDGRPAVLHADPSGAGAGEYVEFYGCTTLMVNAPLPFSPTAQASGEGILVEYHLEDSDDH